MADTLPGTPYVESSDLVANYPSVSEDLAERVDLVGILPFADSTARGTALPSPTDGQYSYLQNTNSTEFWNGSAWVAAGVAPGLVHILTSTFTTAGTASVNDVFTTTYDYYIALVDFTASSSTSHTLRLRASGTDNSTSNYRQNVIRSYSTVVNTGSTTSNVFGISNGAWDADTFFLEMKFFNPKLASKTGFQSRMNMLETTGAQNATGGIFHLTDVFDGFTLIPAAGTITGTIRVYGLKNS